MNTLNTAQLASLLKSFKDPSQQTIYVNKSS